MNTLSLAPTAAPTIHDRLRAATIAVADRLHSRGDALAREEGWTVSRIGLTGRRYRSPLFDTRGGAR